MAEAVCPMIPYGDAASVPTQPQVLVWQACGYRCMAPKDERRRVSQLHAPARKPTLCRAHHRH